MIVHKTVNHLISKCETYGSEQWHYSQTDRSRHLPGRQVPTNNGRTSEFNTCSMFIQRHAVHDEICWHTQTSFSPTCSNQLPTYFVNFKTKATVKKKKEKRKKKKWPSKHSITARLEQSRSTNSSTCTNLAQREVVEEGRSSVRLPEGEGRGIAGEFEASTTVLGCNLGLEGPPVLWVSVQSLERGETIERLFNTHLL